MALWPVPDVQKEGAGIRQPPFLLDYRGSGEIAGLRINHDRTFVDALLQIGQRKAFAVVQAAQIS